MAKLRLSRPRETLFRVLLVFRKTGGGVWPVARMVPVRSGSERRVRPGVPTAAAIQDRAVQRSNQRPYMRRDGLRALVP